MALMTLTQARENFLAAMDTLRSSKIRSALTILGIVIGVSSVISMAAIIQGLNKFIQGRVESLGSRTYFISRFPPGTDPSRQPERIRIRKYLEYGYAPAVRDAAPHVQIVTIFGTRGFFFGDSNLVTSGNHSVENNPLFGFKIVNAATDTDCVNNGGTPYNNSSGNWRYDNVTVGGTAGTPRPATACG